MIATIKSQNGKVGEVFHKGKVFSVTYNKENPDSDYLRGLIAYLKKNSLLSFDNSSTPPSRKLSILGRSEKETYLSLNEGLAGLDIEFKNEPKSQAVEIKEGRVS